MTPDNYGVVTEQGDLGLGFNPISPEERNALNENQYRTQQQPSEETENE